MKFFVSIKNFRVVKDAETHFDVGNINILYGPNGGGKSSIIHAILALMNGSKAANLKPFLTLHEQTFIQIFYNGKSIGYRNGEYYCNVGLGEVGGRSIDVILHCLESFWANLNVKRVGVVQGDAVSVYTIPDFDVYGINVNGERISIALSDVWDQKEWNVLTRNPHVFEEIVPSIRMLLGIDHVVNGYAFTNGKWVRVAELSYGERRAMAILLAAYHSDILLVEGFDNGLHIDLAVDILDTLKSWGKTAIVETHAGLLVGAGFKRGWSIHYIYNGKVEKATRENIRSSELLRKETSIYQSIYT